jgi:hypothetical protein
MFPPNGWTWTPFSAPERTIESPEPETEPEPEPALTTDERLAAARRDGACCYRCREFFQYAEPNRTLAGEGIEARVLECWRCQQDPFRPGTRRRLPYR